MTQYQAASKVAPENSGLDIGQLYGRLLDCKWQIVYVSIFFAVAGLCYALLKAPVYRADSLIQIEDSASSNPLADASKLLSQGPPSQSEIEIIQSRMVLGRAVDILNLDLLVEPVRLPVVGEFLNRVKIERPDSFMKDALGDIGIAWPAIPAGWGYTWSGETIKVESMPVADKHMGASFIVEVVDKDNYNIFSEGELVGQGQVGTPVEFMNGENSVTISSINAPPGAQFKLTHISRLDAIDSLRSNLSITERGQDTGILNWGLTGTDPALVESTLAAITDIYITQNIQRQSAEARKSLNFLTEQVPVVSAGLNKAEELLNTYRTDRNSVDLSLETQSVLERIVDLEAEINELSFAESEISRRFTPSHPTYAALLEKKAQLQKERASLESKVESLPETQQEILRLQRDVAVTQEIYVQLRNKIQEMQIAEASTVGNVRVLDVAKVFPEPIEPNKKLVVVLATLLGLALAVSVVLFRAMFNRGIETPDQIEQIGLPVYATVPLSEEQQKLNQYVRRGMGRRYSIPAALLADRKPTDIAIEALRGLRTSLYFAMLDVDDNRLMIAGPSPSIGKSFITANLAAICAQAGQRVLIIDGDMRKGHIHSMFGEVSEGGLSEVLAGRQAIEEMIRPVDGIDNLHYLSRGVSPPNPSELLVIGGFREMLDKVSAHYDLVIIDSPPVLAVTDAAIIGKHVGISLLVARFQLNPVKEIELARRRLETSGVTVKGAVLNAMERKASVAYSYYNYSYE